MLISIFKNATSTEPINVSMSDVVKYIIDGKWKDKVYAARALSGDHYDKAKRDLPAVTWSGTFSERKASALIDYSGYVVLDIDHLDRTQLVSLKAKLSEDEYVCFAFASPSDKGIKILVKVNTEAEHHLAAFLHLQNYFENKYLLKVDDSGKDICRLCFVSFDQFAINKTGKVFEVDKKYGIVNHYVLPPGLANYKVTTDILKIYDTCVKWVGNTVAYIKGMRNRYCHALACALNRCGVSAADCEGLLMNNYDLDQKEIAHIVKSAYFHNSHEHGTVEVKDLAGATGKFKAPPFIPNFTDDVVLNDLMRITANLHHYKVGKPEILDVVGKVAKYYKKEGLVDLDRKGLVQLMNEAIKTYNAKIIEETDGLSLNYVTAEEIGNEIINIDFNEKSIPTTFEDIDAATRGGLIPGNFYIMVGVGGTYKSILAQYISVATAFKDKAVLYLNGEMSQMQFYERLCSMTMHLNLYKEMNAGRINKGNISELISEMNKVLKHNLFFVGGTGFGKDAILATISNIEAKSGKKIALVIIDGISQMDSMNMAEIPAAIENTRLAKEIAKEAHDSEGIVVIGLMHVSGEQELAKVRRDNSLNCRGGGKTIANSDGYFSTSLLIDPAVNDLDNPGDVMYLENKFYLRFHDKRNNGGTVNQIINVGEFIKLEVENCDPKSYEVKMMSKR